MSGRDEKLHAGLAYIARDWGVFVLSPSKMPVANCEPCRAAHTTPATPTTNAAASHGA